MHVRIRAVLARVGMPTLVEGGRVGLAHTSSPEAGPHAHPASDFTYQPSSHHTPDFTSGVQAFCAPESQRQVSVKHVRHGYGYGEGEQPQT